MRDDEVIAAAEAGLAMAFNLHAPYPALASGVGFQPEADISDRCWPPFRRAKRREALGVRQE
jgi:hypothetical protein